MNKAARVGSHNSSKIAPMGAKLYTSTDLQRNAKSAAPVISKNNILLVRCLGEMADDNIIIGLVNLSF